MPNYKWIEKDGKRILYMHLASRNLAEVESKIAEFKSVISIQPPRSLLTITDIEGGNFSKDMVNLIKEFVKHNEPYIKMTVVIGLDGLKRIVYNSTMRLTGRKNIIAKGSLEEAVDLLLKV